MTTALTVPQLKYEVTLDRRDVHRVALSEVLLCDTMGLAGGDDDFAFGAQLPPFHRYFRRDRDRIDLSLVAEVLRQSTIALAHIHYLVPYGRAFLMSRLSVHLERGSTLPPDVPLDIVVECHVTDVVRRGGEVTALHNALSFTYQGTQFARGTGDLAIVSPRLYDRLRGAHHDDFNAVTVPSPSSIPPSAVAALHADQVVVDADHDHASSWLVRVDPRHTTFFDHAVDHLPGMVLIEAAQQVARLALGSPIARIRGLAGQFVAYFDLDSPIRIRHELGVASRLRLVAEQNGHTGAVLDVDVDVDVDG